MPRPRLQEWALGRALALPTYTMLDKTGPAHAPTITVSVNIDGLGEIKAEGPSRRVAEQDAARVALETFADGSENMNEPSQTRCGFIAVLGAPNAGKSTLVNAIVGTKVSIVTHKVQTTRGRVMGIRIVENDQIVFVDTPGIFMPKKKLERAMVDAAWSGADDADMALLLVDAAAGMSADLQLILERLKASGRKVLIAINKIDAVPKEKLLPLAGAIDGSGAA